MAIGEQLALEADTLREILADVVGAGVLSEVMVLSTCNRVEVYGVAVRAASGFGAGVAYTSGA